MNRKTLPIIFLAFSTILFSCKSKEQKSDAYGNFEVIEVMVAAESNGKLLSLNIEEGMYVEEGQIVGMIDTMDLYLNKLKLETAIASIKTGRSSIKSEIDVLEQQKENYEKEYERLKKMFSEGAATQKQMDDVTGAISLIDKQMIAAGTKYNSIDSEIGANQISIQQINHSIDRCKIVSPISGTIVSKYLQQGEFAAAGRAVFKVANLEDMILRAYISGDQLAHVKIGQTVEVLVDYSKDSNKKFEGTVSWISPEAIFTPKIIQTKKERVNMVYPIKISVKNNGEIKRGMPGEVNFK
ncbi:MAG: HlyD family efflux transporter periplasmic adaptor subunit [Bacteroidales bacterium]|jgi:HlyD family secretion protein|nr:HlyD family efflux transporter periplasmic adaptor subunit [Bacteroidales bacterium]